MSHDNDQKGKTPPYKEMLYDNDQKRRVYK